MYCRELGNTYIFFAPIATAASAARRWNRLTGKWRCNVISANIGLILVSRLVSLWEFIAIIRFCCHKESGMYSTLAGFVESGESLEQAVHREVEEEVGVKIKNLSYFNSQPWPFPHSLMMGFLAEYDSGDIVPQPGEIDDAQWFDIDNLPKIPPKLSIAGKLIEAMIQRDMGNE